MRRAIWALILPSLVLAGNTLASDSQVANGDIEKCFWMENTSGEFKWVPASTVYGKELNMQECFEADSCNGGKGLSGGGCYKWGSSPDAPIESCFWMENTSGQFKWVPASTVYHKQLSKQECFEADSCDGGKGLSGGGCYKWATWPDAPRIEW
jgi:hypothetical protein